MCKRTILEKIFGDTRVWQFFANIFATIFVFAKVFAELFVFPTFFPKICILYDRRKCAR